MHGRRIIRNKTHFQKILQRLYPAFDYMEENVDVIGVVLILIVTEMVILKNI